MWDAISRQGAAAGIALVTPDAVEDGETESIAFDLGRYAQTMLLAAWEMGIGSAQACVCEADAAPATLGYSAGLRCDYLVSFGYPAEPDQLAGLSRRPAASRSGSSCTASAGRQDPRSAHR